MDRSKAAFQSKILDQLEGRARELAASAAEARVVLQQAQAEYDYIVGELSELHGQISSFRASQSLKRANMPSRVMRAFPDELLCIIFVEVVDDLRDACWNTWVSNDPVPGVCVDLRNAPLALASVCRRWRLAALNTPYLWSMVAFFLRRFDDLPRFASYVDVFLGRSGISAVDVALDWTALDWEAARADEMTTSLHRLETAASRWRRFCMVIPCQLAAKGREVFNIFRHPTPLLEVFLISTSNDVDVTNREALPRYLPHCPRLATLRVKHCPVLPFRQLAFTPALESLTLTCSLPYSAVCQLLSVVPNLARLHLALQEDPSPDDVQAVRHFALHLPRLRHFVCDHYTDWFLAQLNGQGRIRMPALDSLRLINSELSQIDKFHVHFKDSPLTSLLIENDDDELLRGHADAFSELKSVLHLTIYAPIMGEFFSQLDAIGGLPLLQTLTIKPRKPSRSPELFGNPDHPLAEALLAFVRARTGPATTAPADDDAPSRPCRLEHVHFPDLTHVPSWLISQLRLLTSASFA